MKGHPKNGKLAVSKAGKKAKPSKKNAHALKMASVSHQALKAFKKVAKTIKALLIGKCVKQIAEVRKGCAKGDAGLQGALEELQQLKDIDHNSAGQTLCSASLSKVDGWSPAATKDGGDAQVPEQAATSASMLALFAEHKKLTEVSDLWRGKLKACLAAEKDRLVHVAELKAASAVAKAAEVKGANVRRHVSSGERTQAVFMESLQEADERAVAQDAEKKTMRNRPAVKEAPRASKQPKQPPKAGDVQPTDMDIYRPSSQYAPKPPPAPAYVAKPREEGRRGGAVGQAGQRRPAQQFRTGAAAAAPLAAAAEPKMHPSWIAKQAQKAKQLQVSIPAVGAGGAPNKKIIFD